MCGSSLWNVAAVGLQRREVEREVDPARAEDGGVLAGRAVLLQAADLRRRLGALALALLGAGDVLVGRLLAGARHRRGLRVEELGDRLLQLLLAGDEVDVVRRRGHAELDLVDRVARGEEDGLREPEDLLRRVQRLVAVEVAAEDARELLEVAGRDAAAHQLLRALGRAHLAQEVLLAGGADEVVVVVAVAHVGERVLAAQLLVARVDVDRRVAAGARVVVEVVAIDVGVDAVDVVDRLLEAAEVDRDDVVDLEVAAADGEQVLDRPDREALAARRIRLVDLHAVADAGDRHEEVARDRGHRDHLLVRIQADEQDGVRPRREPFHLVLVADVGAEDHQRLRLAGVRPVDLGDLDRRAARLAQLVEHRVDLQQPRGRDRAGGGEADEDAGEQRPPDQPAAGARRRLVGEQLLGAHASPPSTARSPGPGSTSEDGSCSTKSHSAWR